jgi:hypothetical protein
LSDAVAAGTRATDVVDVPAGFDRVETELIGRLRRRNTILVAGHLAHQSGAQDAINALVVAAGLTILRDEGVHTDARGFLRLLDAAACFLNAAARAVSVRRLRTTRKGGVRF